MRSSLLTVLLAVAVVAIPIATVLILPAIPSLARPAPLFAPSMPTDPTPLEFQPQTIGPEPLYHAWITNVQIVDLDNDAQQDLLVCDARKNSIFWYRQYVPESWQEHRIGSDLLAPAHATPIDFDADGDIDILAANLGNIEPDDGVIGSIVLLENTGSEFTQHLLLDDVRRIADVQAADFDGDGDLDLAVAVFGYNRGEVLWLENHGDNRFQKHVLLSEAGAIHVPIADYDGDGDPDVAAVISQESEEVWIFDNEGDGHFHPRRIYQTLNFDLGSAGLVQSDLDQDGDTDLVLPAGDNLEDIHSYTQPYHGCYWLENRGNWDFAVRRIAEFGGTYAASVADLDNDGDRDVVLAGMLSDGTDRSASLVWCENDGDQQFRTWRIASRPAHLVTVATGDLDNDGWCDIVAGSLDLVTPLDGPGRVTTWMNQGK